MQLDEMKIQKYYNVPSAAELNDWNMSDPMQ